MADEPRKSNWTEAVECPFCGEDRNVERDGPKWICAVCSKEWLAFNRSDRRMLKAARISPE
jgi:hypothetical protein